MIELTNDTLIFTFPEVHRQAKLSITFQRTFRVPDDGKTYPLPPASDKLPLRHLDDYAERLPEKWRRRGGVITPMYQGEAMWLGLHSASIEGRKAKNATLESWEGNWWCPGVPYPFAVKIAAGKINAVTGGQWEQGLSRTPQNYVVAPAQPWLDGYATESGIVRQFVAMPLGAGYSVEEQLTGAAEYGGLQIEVHPMKRDAFHFYFPKGHSDKETLFFYSSLAEANMSYTFGGRIRQEVYADPFTAASWDTSHSSRCFVHIANSMLWRAITGMNPPGVPLTATEYDRVKLPWFQYYDDTAAPLSVGSRLKGLKSAAEMGKARSDIPLPENESVNADIVINIRKNRGDEQTRKVEF